MTVQLEFSEGGGVSLNRLADATVPAVQLHRALDLERGGISGIP